MPRKQSLNVSLSDTAFFGLTKIADYVLSRFSLETKTKYIRSMDLAFDALASMPDLGTKYKGKLRKLVWEKNTLIFYYYDDINLYITNIEDSRSNYDLRIL